VIAEICLAVVCVVLIVAQYLERQKLLDREQKLLDRLAERSIPVLHDVWRKDETEPLTDSEPVTPREVNTDAY
jgi:hypothetical protein